MHNQFQMSLQLTACYGIVVAGIRSVVSTFGEGVFVAA